ncbi:MAG TPA: DUF3160 domain-containing protein, partial [bacterium]
MPLTLVVLSAPPLQAQSKMALRRYEVKEDLSNVANLNSFKAAIATRTEFVLTQAQRQKLARNAFVAVPSQAEQFFHIYESEHYGMRPRVPNFITSDCVLQLYHLLYDFSLRAIEVEHLLPVLRNLTQAMLEKSHDQYRQISDPTLKAAALKNVSFFGVAAKLLAFPDSTLPSECLAVIEAEVQKINLHEGRIGSSIFPFLHDYTQYIARGHYTRSEELTKFFFAMMWYGQNAFPFYLENRRTEEQIQQALLITKLLQESDRDGVKLLQLWDRIYSITAMYVGSTDDLNVHQFGQLMMEVYGENPTLEALADPNKLSLFYEKSDELPRPRIVSQAMGMPSGLQFRFLGQRFIPDSYMMQKLVNYPYRAWPLGLDVMAVLGSERAAELLDDTYQEPKKWSGYLPNRDKLRIEFAQLTEEEWYQNLFYGWLYALQSLLAERDETYPSFMVNTAWTDKELNTALASWAELRHDTILYGKSSAAEGGDGQEKEAQPKGYVEPVPEFYDRLLKLVRLNQNILQDHGFNLRNRALEQRMQQIEQHRSMRDGKRGESPPKILPPAPVAPDPRYSNYVFHQYENLLVFLRDVARKELAGEIPDSLEYDRIRNFGVEVENLSLRCLELDRNLPAMDWQTGEMTYGSPVFLRGWFEVEGPDRDLACIADVH